MRLAVVVAAGTLATVAAGCGSGTHAPTTTREAISHLHGCPLSAKQHRDVAAAKREIVRLRKLEAPLKTVHPHGSTALENAVTRFLLDVGPLPADVKGRLMNLGKSASALCQDCFNAIEAEEPTVQTRLGRPQCAPR